MKERVKKILRAVPGGTALMRTYRYVVGTPGPEAHFTHIYRTKGWGSNESLSGSGSTLEFTANIRRELPILFEKLGVRVVLDAPCGDYNWFRHIPRDSGPAYIGGDIVAPLIESNQRSYGNENTRFQKLDIINDRLPAADLWLCRDSLIHLSHEHVFRTLANFLRGDIPYLVTTTYPEYDRNTDLQTGPFRKLNLRLPPFSLPEPEQTIEDWIEPYPVRLLGVWRKEALAQSLAGNPSFAPYRPHA